MTTQAQTSKGSSPMLKFLFRMLALAALGGMFLYSKTIGLLAKAAMKAIRASAKQPEAKRRGDEGTGP